MTEKILIISMLILITHPGHGAGDYEIELFPPLPNYTGGDTSSDPDYPGYEIYNFHPDYFFDRYNRLKCGNTINLLGAKIKDVDNALILSGFLELEGIYELWRGNFGIKLFSKFNLTGNDKNLLVTNIGLSHESQHYSGTRGSTMATAYYPIEAGDSIMEERNNMNYFSIGTRYSHSFLNNSNFLFSLGGKFFIDEELPPNYEPFIREYRAGFNTEIIYEFPTTKNNMKYFFGIYYEYISNDIVQTYEYYDPSINDGKSLLSIDFNKTPVTYFIARLGTNFIKEYMIIQPYVIFSASNGRGMLFMLRDTSINIGIRLIPR